MEISAFWNTVDREMARYDLLKHPFYQAWSAGELTSRDLQFYAEQYYHHVSAFPTYLTALHSRLPEGAMRRSVLANACEEECAGVPGGVPGGVPHSQLWLRFVEGMRAASRTDDTHAASAARPTPELLPELRDLIQTFRSLASEAPAPAAFGAFFAYESQVPKIAAEKLAGLKQHYAADDRTCSYFTLHRHADVDHANVWRQILTTLGEQDDNNAREALDGVTQAARALWTALDGIERERQLRSAHTCAAN